MARKPSWRLPKATPTLFRQGDLDLLDQYVIAGLHNRETVVEFLVVDADGENPVMAGISETLDAVTTVSLTQREAKLLEDDLQPDTLNLLASYQFRGTLSGYQDGERLPMHAPAATLAGTLTDALLLSPIIANAITKAVREATGVRLIADEVTQYWRGSKLVLPGHPSTPAVIGGASGFTSLGSSSVATLNPVFAQNLPHITSPTGWGALTPATTAVLDAIQREPGLAEELTLQVLGDAAGTTREALDALTAWGKENNIGLRVAVEVENLDRLLQLRPRRKKKTPEWQPKVTQIHVRTLPQLSAKVVALIVATENESEMIQPLDNILGDGTVYPGGIKTVYREFDENWAPSVEHLVTEATPLVHPDWETQQLPYLMKGKVLFTPDLEDATERATSMNYTAPPVVQVDGSPLSASPDKSSGDGIDDD